MTMVPEFGRCFWRLFEPFVSGKCEGTGLGLAIVKQVANEHGGDVAASNDNGARFEVKFPRGGTK